jgi:hypothetical protein
MGEVQKTTEGVTKPAMKGDNLPPTKKRQIEAFVPETPNKTADGLIEFPCCAILVYANGTRIVLPIRQPKPSAASGKINAWGGGKIALEDNTQVQVGINLTILD